MSKSSQLHRSLSPDQLAFYNEKTISSTKKVKDWIGFFSKISALDKIGDSKVKSFGTLGAVSFVVAFISIFVVVASEEVLILAFTVLCIIAGIIFLSKRKELKNKDVNNYLRMFFLPVLEVLKIKAGENAKLAANLDFRNPRKSMEPVKSTVGVRKQSLFTPVYIISKVKLSDDSLLEFVVKDDIKDLKWTKRSASGKTKYKSKTKFVHHCFVKLTLSKEAYTWDGEQSPDVAVEETETHFVAKSKIKIKKIGDHVLQVKAFFETIQVIYEQFEPKNPTGNATTRQSETNDADDDLMLVPYVWYGSHFDRYDYDSFDYSEAHDMEHSEEGASVFDS